MRLRTILLLLCIQAGVKVWSQNITFSGREVSLQTVFSVVKKQTGFLVVANNEVIKQATPVTIEASELPLRDFLEKVLAPGKLSYAIEGNTISISKPITTPAPAGKGRLLVTVTDENDRPLEGATVQLKNYGAGDVTGKEGVLLLQSVPEGTYTVEISFVGMEKVLRKISVVADQQAILKVMLKPAVNNMEEMIVRGYGSVNRSANTGSIAKVKGEELMKQNHPNPLSALQGRAAGVAITSTSGGLGANVDIQIRGFNSLAAGALPLYIIDGVPMSAEPLNMRSAGTVTSLSPMNSINPADIESIEILKDADATAIYGSRGSNGVVLITTHKAKAGQSKFKLDANTGVGKAAIMMKMLDTKRYLELRREAFAIDELEPDETNAPDLELWDNNAYTNWPKLLYGNSAPSSNVQATLSGGDGNTRFIAALGYYHQKSILAGNENEDRVNIHFNLEHHSQDKKLAASFTTNVSSDHLNMLGESINDAYRLPPNFPMYDADGKFTYIPGYTNPYPKLLTSASNQTNNVLVSGNIRYTVLPGLQLKATAGYNRQQFKGVMKFPSISMNPDATVDNQARFNNTDFQSLTVEPQLDYSFKLKENKIQVMVGGAFQHSIRDGMNLSAGDFSSDVLLGDIAAAKTIILRQRFGTQYKYVSGFSRLTFNRNDKYFLNATFRRDGSSRFGPDKRFGNFGALGAAWIFSRENAVADALPFLSYGKLRSSYGITGNDQIEDYKFLEKFTSVSFMYNGLPGLYPSSSFNGRFGWEENRKLEAAMELGFVRNRILLTAAWYMNRCSNQLVDYTLPTQTGFRNFKANLPALLQNQGLEFELSSRNIDGKNFTWTTSANISFVKNELLKYPDLENSPYSQVYVIGKPANVYWGLDFERTDPETGAPVYKEKNGDNMTGYEDYYPLGAMNPKFFGGVGNQLRYKGFELDIFFQFSEQNGYNWIHGEMKAPGTMQNVPELFLGNYWQAKGDTKPYQRLTATTGSDLGSLYTEYSYSSAAYQNIKYLRLKNVVFAWNFPATWLKKAKIRNARIYVQSQNLLTFSNLKGIDPETGTNIPLMKTFTAGFQLSF